MSKTAHLYLLDNPSKRLELKSSQPLTIGSASKNLLALVSHFGVSPHHAVVRCTPTHGWVVCDWQSSDGTYLEGERIRRCRPLSHGDEIRLGRQGPVLVFSLDDSAAASASEPEATAALTSAQAPPPKPPRSIDIDGSSVLLLQIRTVTVLSEPHFPHIFSWWLLASVTLLLVLPFRIGALPIFWHLELAALAGWIFLGSRKNHVVIIVEHDGQAQRRKFANRVTALAHRNGIRKAIGQSVKTH